MTTSTSTVSRSSLLGDGPADDELARRREIVAAATSRGRVSLAAAGDLRSLDFWSDGNALVLLSSATDGDAPMACVLAEGDDALVAWTDLLADPQLTSGAGGAGQGRGTLAAALVEAAVAGSDPSVRCTVVVGAAPGEPARALVRSTTAAGTSWGDDPADQPIDLRTGADAAYWAAALAYLQD